MSPLAKSALDSLVILFAALFGAAIPLSLGKKGQNIAFLSFAAGVMLGAAFFQMLPEAFAVGGYAVFGMVPVGFVFLFLLERCVLAHACEEPLDCEVHGRGHSAFGLTALLGMSAHTLFDGVALGSSVQEGIGLAALVAITAHKVPSSLSLASILHAEGRSGREVLVYVSLFALTIPLGASVYFGLKAVLPFQSFAARALAFSSGTFLYIAVSDLLPHVNRHRGEQRLRHILALGSGLFLMFALAHFLKDSHLE